MKDNIKMTKPLVQGTKVGRWTVLDGMEISSRGEKKLLCRCDCGTVRYVLERSLRYGGSVSCGCLRKEEAEKSLAYDLSNKSFGELTVLGKSVNFHKNGGIWWQCKCSCGKICEYPASLLVTARRIHCGCKTVKKTVAIDIQGRRTGRLVAVEPTEKRDKKGSIIWKCHCDCGMDVEVSYNELLYSNVQSCGCKKKEHDHKLLQYQNHVNGTSIEILKSRKIPIDNTTGAKGVYLIRGKYVAKLVFQKKAYYLGVYDNMEDAKQARLEAEKAVFQATVDYHQKWQERATENPKWAEENPMQIVVEKRNGELEAHFSPSLD